MPDAMPQAAVAPLRIPHTATPEEAEKVYVHLKLNSYATGRVLAIDGGRSDSVLKWDIVDGHRQSRPLLEL